MNKTSKKPTAGSDQQLLIWFSRILRWALGMLILIMGFQAGNDPYVLFFGAAFLATGFLKPRRCLEEGAVPTVHPHGEMRSMYKDMENGISQK